MDESAKEGSGNDAAAGETTEPESSPAEGSAGKPREARRGGRSTKGRGPAWLALLLALAAIALAARPWWPEGLPGSRVERSALEDRVASVEASLERVRRDAQAAQQASGESVDFRPRFDTLEQGFDALADRLDALESETPDIESRLESLNRRFEGLEGNRNSERAALRARISDVESRVGEQLERFRGRLEQMGSNLDQADRELADRLRLVEADSLLAIAGDRLMLDDVSAARRAWSRALDRMELLRGARYEQLKATARDEFERLRGYRPVSTVDEVARLRQLADAASDWPARGAGHPGSHPASEPEPAQSGTGWRERFGNVFDSLVRVERVDPEVLNPLEVERARVRVQALMHGASLALVRSDSSLATRLVEDAAAEIERAFAVDSERVREALGWLREFEPEAAREPPELGEARAEIGRLLGEGR